MGGKVIGSKVASTSRRRSILAAGVSAAAGGLFVLALCLMAIPGTDSGQSVILLNETASSTGEMSLLAGEVRHMIPPVPGGGSTFVKVHPGRSTDPLELYDSSGHGQRLAEPSVLKAGPLVLRVTSVDEDGRIGVEVVRVGMRR